MSKTLFEIRRFLSLFLMMIPAGVCIFSFPSLAAPGEPKTKSVLLCHEVLNPLRLAKPEVCSGTHCKKVYELFDKGTDYEDSSVAYIGIAHQQLVELLQNGESKHSHLRLVLKITGEHPSGQKFLKENISPEELNDDPFERKSRAFLASNEASENSAQGVVLERLKLLTGKYPSNDPVFMKAFAQVLEYVIRPSESGGLIQNETKVSLQDIIAALEDSDLSFSEPTYVSEDLPTEISILANVGDDYAMLTGYQRLKSFMRWLGLPSANVHVERSADRDQVVGLFSGLPTRDGYVLSLKKSILPKVKKMSDGSFQVDQIKLTEIIGIEPVSNRSFEFLRSLK